MQIYNIKSFYTYGGISASNSRYCKITKLNETSWHYSFEDARHWYQRWDYQEPLLRVEEIRLPLGVLDHLKFTIDNWDGSQLATIVIGSNEIPVFELNELETPPAKNIGLSRVLWVGQIQDPYITVPEPLPLSWWQKIGTLGQGIIIGGGLLSLGLLFWKRKK